MTLLQWLDAEKSHATASRRKMYKVVLTLFLGLPLALHAQSSGGPSSSVSYGPSSDASATAAVAAPQTTGSGGFFKRGVFTPTLHDSPVGTFTASYVYQYAPNLVGADRSLMGWSATPEVNFTKYLGLQAEFTGLYMRSVFPAQSRLMIAAGPRVNFAPHGRIRPFAFIEGGEVRLTSQGSDISDWNPVASGGIGFDYKITRGVSFQLIPGQYVAQLQDDHDWNHSFMAKAGITFNLYK
jgi:hypothetical protein